MPLVDLRERLHDTAVVAILSTKVGRGLDTEELSQRCAVGTWTLVGWEHDGQLVACAALERRSQAEVALRALASADDPTGREHARALVDAVMDVAMAEILTVEGQRDDAPFYARYGFAIAPEHDDKGQSARYVRAVAARPATREAIRSVTLAELEAAIRSCWTRESSDDPDDWSPDTPARGQCAATALLVRELLGGEIMIANVLRNGRRVERHAWNRLPSGLTVDLTRDQFRLGESFEEPAPGEPLLMGRASERYAAFAADVRARLAAERAESARS